MRKYSKPDPYYLSKEWRKLRITVLERDKYHCIVPGCPKMAAVVDHIVRRKDGGPDTPSNLRSLCREHDQQIKERPNGKRANGGKLKPIGCGPDGWPLSRSETEMGSKILFRNRDGVSRA